MKCSTVLVVLGLVLVAAQNNHQELMKKLQAAKRVTNQQIHAIHMEWNIDQYPNFLKSCSMHRNGWLELIMRFVLSILDSNIETEHLTNEFVISFTGSSVTAGHDSFFNQSYPIVTSDWMKPAFAAAGVDLVVRNVAFGNNPCMPYDPCVGTIAGFDADMVHWEQSYNCFDQPMYEQFVRQAAFLPKKPLVIYSESSTANWNEADCANAKPKTELTAAEKDLLLSLQEANAQSEVGSLSTAIEELVSIKNKDELRKSFGVLGPIMAAYSGSGIETFSHQAHLPYACLGPYIPKWKAGAAPWHPSVVGHRLRAAHHSYFWLLAFREAIGMLENALSSSSESILDIKNAFQKKRESNDIKHSFPASPLSKLPSIPDHVQCFTDMVPRAEIGHSISALIVGGKFEMGTMETSKMLPDSWGSVIQEMVLNTNIIRNGLSKGQEDFKFVVYGNRASGPLSLVYNVKETGHSFLCEANGVWGKMPAGWGNLVDSIAEVYVTENVLEGQDAFKFVKENAVLLTMTHNKKVMDTCYELQHTFKKGRHVLTIVPTSDLYVSLSYVLIP